MAVSWKWLLTKGRFLFVFVKENQQDDMYASRRGGGEILYWSPRLESINCAIIIYININMHYVGTMLAALDPGSLGLYL